MGDFEEDVEDERPIVCAFNFAVENGAFNIGFSYITERDRSSLDDKLSKKICLYQFLDNSQFSNLESLLVMVNPSVCYIPDDKNTCKTEFKKINNICESLELNVIKKKSKHWAVDDNTVQDLKTILCVDSMNRFNRELDQTVAMKALSCLISQQLLSASESYGCYDMRCESLDQYVKLDTAAIKSLNLLPSKTDVNKESSVHGILDKTVTKKLGTKLLSRWLRQPLLDYDALMRRQKIVEFFHENQEMRESIRGFLKQVPDLDKIIRRLQADKSNLEDLYKLYLFISKLPNLLDMLTLEQPTKGEDDPIDTDTRKHFNDLLERIKYLTTAQRFGLFKQLCENVIDLDKAPREFVVRVQHDDTGNLSEIDARLTKVAKKVNNRRAELEENELSEVDPKWENDLKMLNTYGYHFRIMKRHDTALQRLKGANYKYLNVVQACIRWSTTDLKDLHETYQSYSQQYESAQRKLVRSACDTGKSFVPLFEMAANIVAEMDVLASFAHVAATIPVASYVKPVICKLGMGEIDLVAARHPCLELQEDVKFIPNDYSLNRKDKHFQILTGPNMGGKSTYIRQLGVIVIMAQIGSYVPCSSAKLPMMDAVLARVGASDAQLRGVSTFMAEMIEASTILSTATSNSLVIIDELGRGTSTYDGFGLAWAISEYLIRKAHSFCLFATHFHELTALPNKIPGAFNRHVTALVTDDSITFLYTVNDGPCDESYGINIAKQAGFPTDVIKDAKRKATELEIKLPSAKIRKLGNVDLVKKFLSVPMDDESELSEQELKSRLIDLKSSVAA